LNAYGVALNASGQVYMLSGGVQELSATGVPITQWSTGMGSPCGIAVDSSGNVYVVNSQINSQIAAVLEYSPGGTLITQWGTFGTGNGQFEGPDGIAVGPNGVVYVSDNDYNPSVCRVEEFSSNGTYLGQWGSYGKGNGQFDVANAIAVNASGDVYVLDFGNHRVQEFSATGAYITQWGSYGSGNGQFQSPLGMGIDPSGNVYVADGLLYSIQEFTSSGAFIAQWNTPAGGPGYQDVPTGIAVNSNGIYISNYLMPPSNPEPI
jgi:DNA-binding beta-propeller fold protein YncE